MTNLTKAIAVLGVVAGLGVAALPLSSYAAENKVVWAPQTNAEGETNAEWDKTMGEDEKGNKWVQTSVGVQFKIEEGIEIAVTDKAGEGSASADLVDLNANSAVDGIFSNSINVNVIANNKDGYTLKLIANGTTGHETDLLGENTNETIETGTPTDRASAWGFQIDENTAWNEVATAGTTLKSQSTATTAAGTNTKVTFGVSAKSDQAADTYKGSVVFRATAGAQPTTGE